MNQRTIDGGAGSIGVLSELAKIFGVKVKRAKVMLTDASMLTRQVRATYRRHQIELLASEDLILADVEARYGSFTLLKVNPRVRSLHQAPVCDVRASGADHQVFNADGKLSQAQSDLINSGLLTRLLEVISPQEGEEINVSQRLVRVFLQRPTTQRVMAVIHAVIEIMPHEDGLKERDAGFEGLPAALRPLLPLVRKWAISDDEERSQKLKRCAPATRRKLASTVVPLLPAIDQFLASFGTNPPEEVCAWGDLAQAALEAQSLLVGGSHNRTR
jgi:hypothetical protein